MYYLLWALAEAQPGMEGVCMQRRNTIPIDISIAIFRLKFLLKKSIHQVLLARFNFVVACMTRYSESRTAVI